MQPHSIPVADSAVPRLSTRDLQSFTAEVPEFVFNNVAHPTRVAKLLDELVEEEQQEFLEGRVR